MFTWPKSGMGAPESMDGTVSYTHLDVYKRQLVLGGGWAGWVHRALIFLVISCPCALVISVPLSFFGGIGGASRRGILVKGGAYMDVLANTCLLYTSRCV